MPVAIITGASSGLGIEFFGAIREKCPEIDEIWLVARRKERLQYMADSTPGLLVVPVPIDLINIDSLEVLHKVLETRKPDLKILINNAGIGMFGDVYDSDYRDLSAMAALNVEGLTAVTTMCLPYMPIGGLIMNISSIAAFVPTPGMATYSATKAFVSAFSKALGYELKSRGINVIAVCPGPMDTEFNTVAGIAEGDSPTFESLPKDEAPVVARKSLVAGLKGKKIYVGRKFYKLYRFIAKVIPHRILMRFTDL